MEERFTKKKKNGMKNREVASSYKIKSKNHLITTNYIKLNEFLMTVFFLF